MAMPRTLPGPVGVSAGVYVHDQLTRLEHLLGNLYAADMTLVQIERLEAALMKAHVRNQLRVTEYLETHGEET